MEQSVYLRIKGIVGVSSVFFPRRLLEDYIAKRDSGKMRIRKRREKRDFVFLETDKGILMVAPWTELSLWKLLEMQR